MTIQIPINENNPTKCNCIECRFAALNPLHNAIFGCYYCAMTGFEDYPTNNIPCRELKRQKKNDT